MIARPSRLEGWTLPLVRELAASGIAENDWYDLKENLQGQAEHQRTVVAAFANTQGGFLVFGVTNARQVVGLDNRELPRDFGNKLTHGLNPSVAFRFSAPLTVPETTYPVWVCEIPRSQRGPHAVLINENWVFPKRTEAGINVTMSVEEIRSWFNESSQRRSKLRFVREELKRISELGWQVIRELTPIRERAHRASKDRVTVPYNIALLEAYLPELFEDLARNDASARYLAEVRYAAHEADSALERYRISAAQDLAADMYAPLTPDVLWLSYASEAENCAQRVVTNTGLILQAWPESA